MLLPSYFEALKQASDTKKANVFYRTPLKSHVSKTIIITKPRVKRVPIGDSNEEQMKEMKETE